jgi:hypothetical protein
MVGNLNSREREAITENLRSLKQSIGSMAIWMGYGYHFTDLNNIPSILQNNVIYSRRDAESQRLIASEVGDAEILSRTAADIQEYVRFYWRPRTPMLYGIEGIRASDQYLYKGRCAIPVYLCVPLAELFVNPTVRFSDRNAASPYVNFGSTLEFIQGIPFEKVFHDRVFAPSDRDEIIARRQAEIQVHHSFQLTPNTFILVRSPAELSMLREKLPATIYGMWNNRIRISTRVPAFFKRWLFVDRIERHGDSVHLYWNSQATVKAVGKVTLRVRFENLDTGYSVDMHQPPIQWDGTPELHYNGLKSYTWRITVRIEDTVAYTGFLYP